jgi:hypothetical protein
MVPLRLLYATLKLDRKFSFVNEDGMPPVRTGGVGVGFGFAFL